MGSAESKESKLFSAVHKNDLQQIKHILKKKPKLVNVCTPEVVVSIVHTRVPYSIVTVTITTTVAFAAVGAHTTRRGFPR
jgi:hypothetical protein